MPSLRSVIQTALYCAVSFAAPITYSTASCSAGPQTVQSASSCSLEVRPPGYSEPAIARAGAGYGSVYFYARGTRDATNLYGAGASAVVDSFEEVLPDGPVRPGFVYMLADTWVDKTESRPLVSLRFGDYTWLGPGQYGMVGTRPYPITLGVPIWIHFHMEASGSSDADRNTVPYATVRFPLAYRFTEADGITPVSFTSVEIPEPGCSLLLFGAVLVAAKLDRARRSHLSRSSRELLP